MDILVLPTMSGGLAPFQLDELDEDDDELNAADQFEALSRRVVHAWLEQPRDRRKAGRDRWLERLVYDFFHTGFANALCEKKLKKLFRSRIEKFDRGKRGVKISSNPFAMALLALFADESRGPSPQRRHDMGALLLAAYRHYVPPALLAGFDSQTGAAGRQRLATGTDIAPGFEDWVVHQRLNEQLFKYKPYKRGPYSKTIKSRIEALKHEFELSNGNNSCGKEIFASLASGGINCGLNYRYLRVLV